MMGTSQHELEAALAQERELNLTLSEAYHLAVKALEAMTIERDFWHKTADERAAEINRLKALLPLDT